MAVPLPAIRSRIRVDSFKDGMPGPFIRVSQAEGDSMEYEPYDHLDEIEKKRLSDFGAWGNMVKSAVGTGLFAMPNAFAFVGLINGIGGTVFLGVLITGALQMLLAAHYKMCKLQKKVELSYDVTLMTCYIGIGSVYVVFISGAVQEMMDSAQSIQIQLYPFMLFPFFLAVNTIKNLKYFVPLSLLGNLFIFAAAIIGTVYSVKDGIGDNYKYIRGEFELYPRFIGAVFFSMCSPGLILSIQQDMKHPGHYPGWCGVLNWGMIVCILSHVGMGIVGYLKWGEDAQGNFLRNQENDIGTYAALIMQALSIYFSYGLQCYMPITILHDDYAIPALESGFCCGTPMLWDLLIRFSLTLLTCLLAATIPKLDLFINLVGAFCIATLGVLVPVLLHILIEIGHYGRCRWRLWLSIVIFIVGFIAMMCAGIVSLIFIVQFFAYGDQPSPKGGAAEKSAAT